jgi:hypothetical protein
VCWMQYKVHTLIARMRQEIGVLNTVVKYLMPNPVAIKPLIY